MELKKLSILLLCISIMPACYAYETNSKKQITLVADQWCPYNCVPDSEKPGLLIEIANHVFSRAGYEVKYIVKPWNRSILMVRNGSYDGIIGSGRGETPDFIFPDEPLISITHLFYVRGTSGWTYKGLQSLNNIKLGVVKNYSYGSLLKEYIEPNKEDRMRITIVHGDDGFIRLAELLKRGRVDAIVEESNIVLRYLSRPDAYRNIKSSGIASKEDIYIAFSPKKSSSKLYARILSKGFEKIKRSGELKRLMHKYALIGMRTEK